MCKDYLPTARQDLFMKTTKEVIKQQRLSLTTSRSRQHHRGQKSTPQTSQPSFTSRGRAPRLASQPRGPPTTRPSTTLGKPTTRTTNYEAEHHAWQANHEDHRLRGQAPRLASQPRGPPTTRPSNTLGKPTTRTTNYEAKQHTWQANHEDHRL